MNILILAEVSACRVEGGADRMLREQAIALHKLGHNVCLLVREPPNDTAAEASFEGITEYRYKANRTSAISFVLSSITNSVRIFDHLINTGFTPEVTIIDQSLAGFGPLLFRRDRCASWIYQSFSLAHEEYLTRNTPDMGLLKRFIYFLNVKARLWIERWTMRTSDSVIVMSEFMRQRVIANHAIKEDRIHLLPGAADTGRFHPLADKSAVRARLNLPESKTILLTVRNLVPRMGLDNLIKAMSSPGASDPNLQLLIGGNGILREPLIQLTQTLGLESRISFKGFIPEDDLPAYYQAADLVIMPTLMLEGFGLVTVEALACGTPVLGTQAGATPEILGAIDPRLIIAGTDDRSIADALGKILPIIKENGTEWNVIRTKCLEAVSRTYNWQQHGERLTTLLLDKRTQK